MCGRLTMRSAVQLLNINCDWERPSVTIPCPSCNTPKKLNIVFDNHSGDGTFRCPKCNFQGGPLQFWAFYRNLGNVSSKDAAKDFHEFTEGKNGAIPASTAKYIPKSRIDVDTAGIEVRNKTYNALLDELTLSDRHRKDLLRRGMTDREIRENGYKSYPITEKEVYCELLISKGYVLKGVPGFYQKEDGKWTMMCCGKGGYLIPQRDGKGRIQGMQIRSDDASYGKYLTLSSCEKLNGSKGRAYCHFTRGRKGLKDIILTEGPLKGDIISYYTGYSVLAVQGVNSLKAVKGAIADLYNSGLLNKVSLAYDMDLYRNEHVTSALSDLKEMLRSFEIPFSQIDWQKDYEKKDIKGLDDWLFANLEGPVLE